MNNLSIAELLRARKLKNENAERVQPSNDKPNSKATTVASTTSGKSDSSESSAATPSRSNPSHSPAGSGSATHSDEPSHPHPTNQATDAPSNRSLAQFPAASILCLTLLVFTFALGFHWQLSARIRVQAERDTLMAELSEMPARLVISRSLATLNQEIARLENKRAELSATLTELERDANEQRESLRRGLIVSMNGSKWVQIDAVRTDLPINATMQVMGTWGRIKPRKE